MTAKISDLDAASAPDGTEQLEAVQSGQSTSMTVRQVFEGDKAASLSALQGVDTSTLTDGDTRYMKGRTTTGDGGEGTFIWRTGDKSTEVGNDEVTASGGDGGVWIAPTSDLTGASGAWERIEFCAKKPEMYGVFPGSGTDYFTEMSALASGLSEYDAIEFGPGPYEWDGGVTFTQNNITINWNGTRLLLGDTGPSATLSDSITSGKIGLLFKQTDNLTLTGSVFAIGQGTAGTTSLAGMVFDNCEKVRAPAFMRFETMAIGRSIIECLRSDFGDAHGEQIDGLQTFESPPSTTAGTVENVIGCEDSTFGDITSYNGEKPARYLSVGFSSGDNVACTFGSSIHEHDSSSLTGHALAIRSADACSFGPCISTGGANSVLQVVQFSGDQALGYNIKDIHIDAVLGDSGNTGASVDALVYVESLDTLDFGSISIGTVSGDVNGEYGIFNTSGDLRIGRCSLRGSATRFVGTLAGSAGFTPETCINQLDIGQYGGSASPIVTGKGGYTQIDHLNVKQGPDNAISILCRYDSALGNGTHHSGIHIGDIRYRQSGAANNYNYLVYDDSETAGPDKVTLRDVIYSEAALADMVIKAGDFFARKGTLQDTGVPSSGTWSEGQQVFDQTPASASAMGWVCATSGTFSSATDATGDTDGSTAVITGMTDTSDFAVGQHVSVSAGFPTTGPYQIRAITATTMTISVASDSVQSNITVATVDPTFVTMPSYA